MAGVALCLGGKLIGKKWDVLFLTVLVNEAQHLVFVLSGRFEPKYARKEAPFPMSLETSTPDYLAKKYIDSKHIVDKVKYIMQPMLHTVKKADINNTISGKSGPGTSLTTLNYKISQARNYLTR